MESIGKIEKHIIGAIYLKFINFHSTSFSLLKDIVHKKSLSAY